ncbi:hypothetical protein EMGBS6_10860 [Opitutia bacterium]|nr:hypothetical protein EMGBS6_10860 [Opitutae bacterium]
MLSASSRLAPPSSGTVRGPVRAPLTDLKPAEIEQLAALIAKAGVK